MSIIWMPQTAEEKERERVESERQHREDRRMGKCVICGADLATHINRGILICAHTHQKQYEEFISHVET